MGPRPQFLVESVMLLSTEMKCEYQLGEKELDDVEEMEVKSLMYQDEGSKGARLRL